MGLTGIFAVPLVSNSASMRVLEQAGYIREGVLRRSAIKKASYLSRYSIASWTWMCCLEFPVSVELIKESLGWIDRGFRTRFKHYQNRCKMGSRPLRYSGASTGQRTDTLVVSSRDAATQRIQPGPACGRGRGCCLRDEPNRRATVREDDIVSRSVATSAATESFGLRGGCQEAFRRYRLLEGAFGSGGEDNQ